MIFLSLFMDLMLMFGGWGGATVANGVEGEVYQAHTVHGHLPGPPGEHPEGVSHEHHGAHGHIEPTPGAGHVSH